MFRKTADNFQTKTLLPFLVLILFLGLVACAPIGPTAVDIVSESADAGESTETDIQKEDPAVVEPGDGDFLNEEAPVDEFYFSAGPYRLFHDPQLVIDNQPPTELVPINTDSGPGLLPYPEFAHFDLFMEQAQVYIAPVDDYKHLLGSAAETMERLRGLIADPAVHEGCVPELPLDRFNHECGHQRFIANLAPLSFQNGAGIRFVTVYAIHNSVPVGNDNLLYVFQGFTDDEKYYVKVIVRQMHKSLPQSSEEISEEFYSTFNPKIVQDYYEDIKSGLEEDMDGYSPALDWIDAFIRTFRVERPD